MTGESPDLPSNEEQALNEAERAVGELLRAMQQLESFQHNLSYPSQEQPEISELAQNLLHVVAEHRRQAGQPIAQSREASAQPERSPFDWDDDEGA